MVSESIERLPPHALSSQRVVELQQIDFEHGLTDAEVQSRRRQHGSNALVQAPRKPMWLRLANQFNALVIWILIGAAVVSGALGEWMDAAAIIAIVLLNGVLGFVQEERAERALAALQAMSAPRAKAFRDGRVVSLPAVELVPGDRIELEAGDHVPADARLIRSHGLRALEALLTGESVPAEKNQHSVFDVQTPLGDRGNMAFMGTHITGGSASAVVVATGMSTELGTIAGLVQQQPPRPTPLQLKLADLGRRLVWIVLFLILIIFVLEFWRGGSPLDLFLIAVSLAVAAVPEGLPAVVTIALALGLQRMARRQALVRRLPSVETLGAVTIICSDKTGTLTRNEMTVREVLAGGHAYVVTGSGYTPEGQYLDKATGTLSAITGDLRQLLTIGARCNHARLNHSKSGWAIVGDPTEGALLVAAMKGAVCIADPYKQIVCENPFDSERKSMSVLFEEPDHRYTLYAKGAPEILLKQCRFQLHDGRVEPLEGDARQRILQVAQRMGKQALRVLALAYRSAGSSSDANEQHLIFAGLVGMIDPPRDEVREAVKRCKAAGIRPLMITGDHPGTALAIAQDLGIAVEQMKVCTGVELDAMSDRELSDRLDQIAVYARVTAAHKLRIVRAWQSRGQIVAMTGDGVNDAPAIKAADIGIAMSISGTDVTKEASDMVLVDDNFASIVNAVEEGRAIFDNIRKFVHYLLASNSGEVLLMFAAALLDWPTPLLAIQILWINLVTDALPALGLGVEKPEPEVMRRPPRPPRESVLSRSAVMRLLWHGALMATVSLMAFRMVYQDSDANLSRARTAAFCTITFSQLLFAFACRSERLPAITLGLGSNRWLLLAVGSSIVVQTLTVLVGPARTVFKTATLSLSDWGWIAGLSLVPLVVIEATKYARKSRSASVIEVTPRICSDNPLNREKMDETCSGIHKLQL